MTSYRTALREGVTAVIKGAAAAPLAKQVHAVCINNLEYNTLLLWVTRAWAAF